MEHSQAQCSMLQLRSALEASCSGRTVDECQPVPQQSHLFANGRYRLLREINKGATAVVYEAEDFGVHGFEPWEKPARVALKVLRSGPCGGFIVPDSAVQREIACASSVDHRNIAKLLDVVSDEDQLAFAIELIEGPDLLDYIEQCNRRMPEELALHYFRQLLDAVAYLHATGIAHRDLKPENCMIDLRTHTLKLIDFGLAAPLDAHVPLGCGTIYTIAPECIEQLGVNRSPNPVAIDVWGLGVTLYIALAGRFPFQDPRQPHNDQAVITNTLAGCLAPFPSHISPAARELVLRMLQSQPEKRPSLEEIAVHPWVTQRLHLQTLFALEEKLFRSSRSSSLESVGESDDSDQMAGEEQPMTLEQSEEQSEAHLLVDRHAARLRPHGSLRSRLQQRFERASERRNIRELRFNSRRERRREAASVRHARSGSAPELSVPQQHARSDTTSNGSSYTMLQPELISAALSMGGRHSATAALQQQQVEEQSPKLPSVPHPAASFGKEAESCCVPRANARLFAVSADTRTSPDPEPPGFPNRSSSSASGKAQAPSSSECSLRSDSSTYDCSRRSDAFTTHRHARSAEHAHTGLPPLAPRPPRTSYSDIPMYSQSQVMRLPESYGGRAQNTRTLQDNPCCWAAYAPA